MQSTNTPQEGIMEDQSNLYVVSLDREQHEKTCGYWYTVTKGALAHTAFATRAGLDRWLRERNLKLESALPQQGTWGTSRIVGTYNQHQHMDTEAFDAVQPVLATAVMSNGDYTLGLISEDQDGVRTVHYLNPNVKTRLVFDYAQTRKVMS